MAGHLNGLAGADLHLLRVFMAVTEAGGFSRAQIELNVGQSTISTQMTDLETRLGGISLCRRGRAGFALTQEGREVYEAARELFGSCERFVARINRLHGDIIGDLHLAAADALLGHPGFSLAGLVAELRRQLPSVNLHLQVLDPLEIETRLLDGTLHGGLHYFPNHVPGLRYSVMFLEDQHLYCGRGHPLFDRSAQSDPGEIAKFAYVSRSYYGGETRTGGFRACNRVSSANNMESLVAMILSGTFLGHLPAQVAAPWLERGVIRMLSPTEFTYTTQFEYARAAGVGGSRVQAVLDAAMGKAAAKEFAGTP